MKGKRSGEIDEDNFKPPSEGEAITDGGRLGYRLIQVDVDCVVHPHAKSLKFCLDSSIGPNIQLLTNVQFSDIVTLLQEQASRL